MSRIALWCLLILIYISVTISASIILGANDEQDFLYFLLHGAVNHAIAIVLMLTLIIAVAISVMPQRWWQWLLLMLVLGNVAVITGYGLLLSKPQPCTAQMMANHYTSHLQEINNLADCISQSLPRRTLDSMKFGADAAFIESYEFDEAGRFLRLVAGSPDFLGHEFFKMFAAEHGQDDVYTDCSMATHDEHIADSMLLNRLDSNIVLNDTVVLRCDNYYVWLEFPEDNLLHIQPELVNKYMATCFPDKQQFRPLPQ